MVVLLELRMPTPQGKSLRQMLLTLLNMGGLLGTNNGQPSRRGALNNSYAYSSVDSCTGNVRIRPYSNWRTGGKQCLWIREIIEASYWDTDKTPGSARPRAMAVALAPVLAGAGLQRPKCRMAVLPLLWGLPSSKGLASIPSSTSANLRPVRGMHLSNVSLAALSWWWAKIS